MKKATPYITYEEIRTAKALDRKRDWDRLARGEITAQEFQKQYSAIPEQFVRNCRIINLRQVAAAFHRRKKSSLR